MIDVSGITAALGVPCMVSGKMHKAITSWEKAYSDKSPWLTDRIRSMRLPATIARELKRLSLTEITVSADDPELESAMKSTVRQLRRELDCGIAMGGLILKPYYTQTGTAAQLVLRVQRRKGSHHDAGQQHEIKCMKAFRG